MAQGSPNYAITPNSSGAVVVSGDTSPNAPTSGVAIWTAGANGGRLERISFLGMGTTVGAKLRIFRYNIAASGYFPYCEVAVGAASGNVATSGAFAATLEAVTTPQYMPMVVGSGWGVYATVTVTQTSGIAITTDGGNF